MLEELLPAEALFGVGFEHLSDEIFAHFRDIVDSSREVIVLLVYHHLQLVDVLGVVRWSTCHSEYLPKSIQ